VTEPPGGSVPPSILDLLRCPVCGGLIGEQAGELTCGAGHVLRREDGYIDARPARASAATEATFRSFGYEWTQFNRIQPEDEAYWHWYFADLDLPSLRGRVGLDAGCGKGRYTIFTSRHLKAMVALDGSDAVRAAATNLAGCPNVTVVRADLRSAPFGSESFGFVSCLGVLHHLEDPERGFDALVHLLGPGGILLVYVYSRPTRLDARSIGLLAARGLRRFTTRLSSRAVRLASWPLAFFLWVTVVQAGAHWRRKSATLPLQAYHGKPMRALWLDTFDRLSAPIEHRYTWADIRPWYEARGLLVDQVRDDSGLIVLAHRP
jgi:SAM-dependent methyltransferase